MTFTSALDPVSTHRWALTTPEKAGVESRFRLPPETDTVPKGTQFGDSVVPGNASWKDETGAAAHAAVAACAPAPSSALAVVNPIACAWALALAVSFRGIVAGCGDGRCSSLRSRSASRRQGAWR